MLKSMTVQRSLLAGAAAGFLALAAGVIPGATPAQAADGVRPGAGRVVRDSAERVVRVGGGKVDAISVARGKSETLRVDVPFADLVVGDPEIADVVPLTDRSFYILGRAVGGTNVSVYDAKKQLIGIMDIEVGFDAARLQAEIAQRLPASQISVSTVNGKLMLSGTVRDAPSVDRAVTIARQFGPEVINSLTVGSAQQVMLEVRFVEASRDAGRDLGINWGIRSTDVKYQPGVGFGPGSISYPNNQTNGGVFAGAGQLLSGNAPFGVAVAQILGNGIAADVLIRGLEERGIARRLAEPNLVALSGETASFLAGGEYPIPIASKDGTVTIDYKQFGVGLAFTPTVLDRGLINLKIVPEVSELDYSNPLTLAGTSIPSLVVRRANTSIELRDGQSFAIAGLLQSNASSLVNQYPWLGGVPVLGMLFRSSTYQKHESELVIIVTPRLVRPVVPGQVLKTPLDTLKPANDVDLFVNGRGELSAAQLRLVEKGGELTSLTGHIIDSPKGGTRVAKR
jgi:pilus assembly protein CpaC